MEALYQRRVGEQRRIGISIDIGGSSYKTPD